MPRTRRTLLIVSGLLGALAVGLGAYGAHGLENALAGAEDAAKRLDWWQTAVSYHLVHAVMLAVSASLANAASKRLIVAGAGFALGVLLFSGSLYAMSLGAPRVLGAVTPLGGLSLIVGWLALGAHALAPRP